MTSNQRREQIVAAAAALFEKNGYHSTNVAMVARAAGIRKPTLYHYFKSKEEILFEIHDEFIRYIVAKQSAREGTGLTATESLREIMTDILLLMDSHRAHLRVFFEHARELTPANQHKIAAKRDRYAAMVESEVARGIAEGELRDVDPRLTTLAIFGMCNWGYQWYIAGGTLSSREIAEEFFDRLFEGLRKRD